MRDVTVSIDILGTLLQGFAASEAHWVLEEGGVGRKSVHPGDSFGKMVVWAWKTDPKLAIELISDYMAQIRYHHELVPETNRITLDQVLGGLPWAIADGWLSRDEVKKLVAHAAQEVPRRFSEDVNQP